MFNYLKKLSNPAHKEPVNQQVQEPSNLISTIFAERSRKTETPHLQQTGNGKVIQFPAPKNNIPEGDVIELPILRIVKKVYPFWLMFFASIGMAVTLLLTIVVSSIILKNFAAFQSAQMATREAQSRKIVAAIQERKAAFNEFSDFEKQALLLEEQVKTIFAKRGFIELPSWPVFVGYADLWRSMKFSGFPPSASETDDIYASWQATEIFLITEVMEVLRKEWKQHPEQYQLESVSFGGDFIPALLALQNKIPPTTRTPSLRQRLVKATVSYPLAFLIIGPKKFENKPREWFRFATNTIRLRFLIDAAHSMGMRKNDWEFKAEEEWLKTHCSTVEMDIRKVLTQIESLPIRARSAMKTGKLQALDCNRF